MCPASLASLSTETLFLIFGEFCLHCQSRYNEGWDTPPMKPRQWHQVQRPNQRSWYGLYRKTLSSLSLVSKRFRSIAQAIMYHEFALGYDDSWRSNSYHFDGKLLSFIRTITSRPDLCPLVKTVYIHPHLLKDIDRCEAREALFKAGEALGIDILTVWKQRQSEGNTTHDAFIASFLDESVNLDKRTRERLDRHLTDKTKSGNKWVAAELVAILIALLPNLEYLSFDRGHGWLVSAVPSSALKAYNISDIPLKTLDFGPHGLSVVQIAPHLETLNIDNNGLGHPVPPLPNLKTLRITKAEMTVSTLEALLAACTGGLQSFAYEAGEPNKWTGWCGTNTPPPSFQFDPDDAVRCLLGHKSSLERIYLNLAKNYETMNLASDVNFKSFVVLESLFLDSAIIYNNSPGRFNGLGSTNADSLIRLLPESLMTLTIFKLQRHKQLKSALLGLAEAIQEQPSRFPQLKHVVSSTKKNRLMYSSAFGAAGVHFSHEVHLLSQLKPYANGPEWIQEWMLPSSSDDEDL